MGMALTDTTKISLADTANNLEAKHNLWIEHN